MKCRNEFTTPTGIKVPCMYCAPCRINKISIWTFRILGEMTNTCKHSFVTYTYDNENIPLEDNHPTLRKYDIQCLHKRMRKDGLKFKYFLCGEYGDTTLRPHYHALYIGVSIKELREAFLGLPRKNPTKEEIKYQKRFLWNYGHIDYGDVTPASIRYVLSYVMTKGRPEDYEPAEPPFQISSNLFGKEFITANLEKYIKNGYFTYKGKPIAIPSFIKEYYKMYELGLTKKPNNWRIGIINRAREKNMSVPTVIELDAQKAYHNEQSLEWRQRQKGNRQAL